jgi:RNA polymerase sigma-70 factor (ECF subfamily)
MLEPSSISAQLAAHLPEALRPWLEQPEGLKERLLSLIASAVRALPELSVPPSVIVPFMAQRLLDGAGNDSLDERHAAELYLICACLHGDARALLAFERQYLSEVMRSLVRMNLGEKTDELKQRMLQLLFVARPGEQPKAAGYAGRGKLTAWLRVIAVREALALLGKNHAEVAWSQDKLNTLPVPEDDLELGYMKRTYRAAFKQALERALLSLPPRTQNLLRQQLIDGLTVTEIGTLYQVHPATAARWLVDARKELGRRVRQELKQRLRISNSECDSIMRLASSELSASISRLLRR